jgi:hypothetical protein
MSNSTELEKKPIYKKKWFLISVFILIIIILLPKGNNNNNDVKQSDNNEEVISKSDTTNNPDKSEVNPTIKIKEKLSSTLFSIDQAKDSYFSNFKGERVFEGVKKFEDWVEVLKNSETIEDKDIQKDCKELRNKIKEKQTKYFPLFRSNYVEFVRGNLFDNDIEVLSSGRGNTSITFQGRTFLLNKNITDFQTKISELLNKLRFKKVEYKGYRGHDGYYYQLETPSDSELI